MAKQSVDNKDICELIREAEAAFISGGGTQTSKYVNSDLYDDINKIYAYLESKHWSGETDSQGREKPFFNIVLAARNVWYRATDIDRKNINIRATRASHITGAFLATVHIQDWMRRENYGAFLNDWGIDLAGFNSSVVKHIETDGRLIPMVVPWSRLIVDQVDFDNNPKIETIELTEAQLYKRIKTHNYDAEMVEQLCDALASRELTDKTDQDTKDNYIKLYEIHGNLPLSYLTGNEQDEDEYAQQMHIVSFVASKEKGQFDDFTLYSGREAQDPYMLTSLLPNTDGSISLMGAVKSLFESQWMVNHGAKGIKDALDIASKQFYQTADKRFVGRNVLTALETGDIFIHEQNMPLTQVNTALPNINAQESFVNMWKGLSSEIAGISESMLGNAAPSGTAWRQVEALLQESHSLFELMTENKALHIEAMFRKFVIPFIKKQMDTTKEISATLESHHLSKIDAMYVPREAIRRYNKRTLKDIETAITQPGAPLPTPYDAIKGQAEVKDELGTMGNQRFFVPSDVDDKTWKEVFKDLEWELEVDITGEQKDKQTILTTLNTMLAVIANPQYADNPRAQLVVDKILSETGVVSPIELSTLPNPQPQPVPPSIGGPSGGLSITQ